MIYIITQCGHCKEFQITTSKTILRCKACNKTTKLFKKSSPSNILFYYEGKPLQASQMLKTLKLLQAEWKGEITREQILKIYPFLK